MPKRAVLHRSVGLRPVRTGPVAVAETTGARTGKPHTTPIGYLHDNGGRTLIIASAAGAPNHPAWYHNLLAHPRVNVETGVFTYEADAVVLDGEERDSIFARAVEADPGWAEYQAKTTRVIPVVALHPVAGGPNAEAWGDGLKLVHDAFRRELEAHLAYEEEQLIPILNAVTSSDQV